MDHTGRFCQHADAHELPVPALMFGDERLEYLLAMRFQAFKRSRIVLTHEARVFDRIGCKDGGKPAFQARSRSPRRLMS